MIIRALDSNGDITFGQGVQNYLTGQNAIAENIQTRLLAQLNNCVWDMASGIDWLTFLRTNSTEAQIILAVKATLLQSFGVVNATQVSVSLNGRNLSLSYNVNTIFTSNFSANLQNLQEIFLNANI